MNRRNVLLGLGTAAAGSGIVFGSGAFTQVQAERSISIGVSNDANALVQLDPNDDVASVYQNNDGELAIDTEKLGDDGEGYNVASTIQIGDTTESFGNEVDETNPAFTITNNRDSDVADDIDIAIDLSNIVPDEEDEITGLEFIATNDNGTSKLIEAGSRKVFRNISSDGSTDSVYVAIRVETSNTTGAFSVDDGVVIQAGSDLTEEEFPTEQPAAANTVMRDSDGTTFDSIQSAIDDSETGTGASLNVGPGTFDESVTIDIDGLTLEGPNAGTSGDSGQRGEEAVITSGLSIAADGVTTDGVQVENSGQDGVRFGPDTVPSDVTIQNTVVTNIAGDSFGSNRGSGDEAAGNGIQFQFNNVQGETASNIVIEDNLISDISTPDTQQRTTAGGINVLPRGNDVDLTIRDNTITGLEAGSSTSGDERVRGINVDTQDDDENGFGRVDGVVIDGNTINDLTAVGDDTGRVKAIQLTEDGDLDPREGVKNFSITNNEFDNLEGDGEYKQTAVFIGGYEDLGADHEISENNLNGNTIVRFSEDGQSGFTRADADTLNATNNWWGSADGPDGRQTQDFVSPSKEASDIIDTGNFAGSPFSDAGNE